MKRIIPGRFFPPMISVALICSSCVETPVQRPDNDFDVSVPAPSFKTSKPLLLFDEGHNNFHTTTGLYEPFANLMRNDGYEVKVLKSMVTAAALEPGAVMVVSNAGGGGDLNDTPAFNAEECKTIRDWVSNGGGLLLVADHFPFGSAAQALGDQFGIEFQKGMVEDSLNYDKSSNDYSQLEFSRENSLLREHEITAGVDRVVTFTGQSLKCSDSCFSFLALSPSAFDLQAYPKVTKDGNDTRVEVNYGSPVSAYGRSQGIALKFGKGRLVVLGEAAMLTAQKTRDEMKVGMNYNAGNKKLALNIMHWLTSRN